MMRNTNGNGAAMHVMKGTGRITPTYHPLTTAGQVDTDSICIGQPPRVLALSVGDISVNSIGSLRRPEVNGAGCQTV